MKNQVISLEVAKLAKENQFNIPTQKAYINNEIFVNYEKVSGYCDNYRIDANDFHKNWNRVGWMFDKGGLRCFGCKLDNKKYFEAYLAPTQSLLQKWLREIHDIHIVISVYRDMDHRDNYDLKIIKHVLIIPLINKKLKGLDILEDFPIKNSIFYTYEEALEEGLKEALLLINH